MAEVPAPVQERLDSTAEVPYECAATGTDPAIATGETAMETETLTDEQLAAALQEARWKLVLSLEVADEARVQVAKLERVLLFRQSARQLAEARRATVDQVG